MFEQPSRKRAGTWTYATPSEPAQRVCLMTTSNTDSNANLVKAKMFPNEHSNANFIFPEHGLSQLDHDSDAIEQYTADVAAAPDISKLDTTSLPSSGVTSARATKPIKARAGTPVPRTEYPFPPQVPTKSVSMNNDLQITTSHSEPVIDASPEQGPVRSEFERWPTPPHPYPNIATYLAATLPPMPNIFPTSPPPADCPTGPRPSISSDYTTVSPRSSMGPKISPWPSMSSDCTTAYSPLSPTTPCTPSTVFDSAAASLKKLLEADDLGMTVSEISELSRFAVGPYRKRAGRVLVKKKATMRRGSSQRRVSKVDRDGRKRSSAVSGSSLDARTRESLAISSGISGRGAGPGTRGSTASSSGISGSAADPGLRGSGARSSMDLHGPIQESPAYPRWREINWSRMSDSSSATLSSVSGPGPMSVSDSQPSQQSNKSFDFGAGMDVDSQEESDGDDYLKIDGTPLGLPRAYMVRDEERRRELDLTRSVPDKVETRVAIWGPCAGGYCCGTCGRCT
ncbi:hypothetical protein LTR70_006107 [Exophiala xenobiotica]|uniref:Uncharacterized protein n=1 Tax=Lithohypha guttulata TaxID=1690604 RepID=A0ABR0K8S6_9EURO|nr:hypothetical protein LTR24_005656 [Lithohypha guttulata]KAK5316860.1 hypothetical protein LTR70_006107 [Exophiala xenobiotica]